MTIRFCKWSPRQILGVFLDFIHPFLTEIDFRLSLAKNSYIILHSIYIYLSNIILQIVIYSWSKHSSHSGFGVIHQSIISWYMVISRYQNIPYPYSIQKRRVRLLSFFKISYFYLPYNFLFHKEVWILAPNAKLKLE